MAAVFLICGFSVGWFCFGGLFFLDFFFFSFLVAVAGFVCLFSAIWLPIVIKILSKSVWWLRPMHFTSRKMLHIYTITWTVLGTGAENRKFYNQCLGLPLACGILRLCLCSSFIKSFPIQVGCCEKWDLRSSTSERRPPWQPWLLLSVPIKNFIGQDCQGWGGVQWLNSFPNHMRPSEGLALDWGVPVCS